MESWLGINVMRLFSFLYIAASYTAHVHISFLRTHMLLFITYVLLS